MVFFPLSNRRSVRHSNVWYRAGGVWGKGHSDQLYARTERLPWISRLDGNEDYVLFSFNTLNVGEASMGLVV